MEICLLSGVIYGCQCSQYWSIYSLVSQVPMDPMRALASLELVSARGLDTPHLGPRMLSDSVRIPKPQANIFLYLGTRDFCVYLHCLQFGSKMVQINKKRVDFVRNLVKMRKASIQSKTFCV